MRRHHRLDMGKRRYQMTDFKWFFENSGPRVLCERDGTTSGPHVVTDCSHLVR